MKYSFLVIILMVITPVFSYADSDVVEVKSKFSCEKTGSCKIKSCDVASVVANPKGDKLTSANVLSMSGIHWKEYSSQVVANIKDKHQLVFLFNRSRNCRWSQRMESSTFKSTAIIQEINNNFLPVYYDFNEESDIAAKYKVIELPTIMILNSDGDLVYSIPGYIEPEKLLGLLKEVNLKFRKQ